MFNPNCDRLLMNKDREIHTSAYPPVSDYMSCGCLKYVSSFLWLCVFCAVFILNIFDLSQESCVAGGATRNRQHLESKRFAFCFDVLGWASCRLHDSFQS